MTRSNTRNTINFSGSAPVILNSTTPDVSSEKSIDRSFPARSNQDRPASSGSLSMDLSDASNISEANTLENGTKCQLTENQIFENAADNIPDGGYGWFIVLACFLINFNTWGANSGFAIYLSYYLNHDTFAGGDKYDYALIGGLTFGVGLFFAPVIIYLQGKIGIRASVIIGNCFQFAALMMASFSKKLWQLYLTQGVLQAFGLAFVSLPSFSIIPQWFKKRRALASSLATAGSGCGGLLYNLGMQKVLEEKSVFWALRVQSIICFSLLWISILLLRTRVKIKYNVFDIKIAKSMGYYIAILFYIFCMFGYVVVLYDMASVTISMGYTAYEGSIASAIVQVGSVLGRPLVGAFADRFGAITVTSFAYLICAILTLAMWIPAKNYATILAYCAILGGLMGLVFACTPPILGLLFGLQRINVALGMSWVFLSVAAIASPVISLTLKEGGTGTVSPGQYNHSALFSGFSFLVAAFALLIMRGYVLARHEMMADKNDDHDHLLVRVPFWSPIKYCFRGGII